MAAYGRELRIIFHDAGLLVFLLFLPLAYPVIYSLIYNPELVRDVAVVVVDNDRSRLSRELVRNLDATQDAWVKGYAANLPEARRAMDSHECYAIIEIPEGFERKARSGGATAAMYNDMSLLLRYRGLVVATTNVMQAMGAQLQTETINTYVPEASSLAPGDPLSIESVFMGNIKSGFDSFLMPGVVILIIHQCLILMVGMSGGTRHEYPSQLGYNPLMHNPPIMADMLGQMFAFLTIMILPTVWVCHYVPLIFEFPMNGDVWQEMLFLLPMLLACICLGMSLQAIVWQREGIFVTWVATSLIFLFLSGLTWPRFAMPDFWRDLGDAIPATLGIEGFIRMNSNGATLEQVRPEYVGLWIQTGAYFVLAYIVQRWVIRPDARRRYIIEWRQVSEVTPDPNSLDQRIEEDLVEAQKGDK